MTQRGRRVAILLAAESFERFFGAELGLTRERYVNAYRNDWAWDYCRMLRDRGMKPLLYVATEGSPALEETSDATVRFIPLGSAYRPWLRWRWMVRSPLGRFGAQLVSTATLLRPLRRALAADGVDVLLVQEYWTGRYDLLALRLAHPLIAVDQGLPDRGEVKLLKGRSLRRAHAVIAQTRAEADKVRGHGGSPTVLPNGVDTTFFVPADGGVAREPATIVNVARLNDGHKRHSDLLRALALLPSPWRLELVGDGPDRRRLEALADDLGLADRVVFLGFEPDKARVRERLQRCTVFALPSAHEGLPVAMLEAMACGAPVVGSDIPAIAEVVRQGGGEVVPVGAVEPLAAAIAAVGADGARHQRAARATVERGYARERVAGELESLIDGAAAARTTRDVS
jgi:glycosyltransferase involved in cell wall biosynthesis